MTTPILTYLQNYQNSGCSRLHMPGHKGHTYIGPEAMDITEIKGADELYFADGIIEESEQNAASLFGTDLTCYSTEGSSHCIRSMMILIRRHYRGAPNQRPVILAGRNAHKAFLYACAICDFDVEWIYPSPEAENSIAACHPSPEEVARHLMEMKQNGKLPAAVYLTSPDYLGQCSDIASAAGICHSYGIPLAVDNAHGAYLHFLPDPVHPMDLGADLCCDSAHKTLPVLTGGAYLHVSSKLFTRAEVKSAMELSGTTSPSYVILASLDRCNAFLAEHGAAAFEEAAEMTKICKQDLLTRGVPILPSECLKIVVDAAALGYTGIELGDHLRSFCAEPEFCDHDYLVCMVTPDTEPKDLRRLYDALVHAKEQNRVPLNKTPLRAVQSSRYVSIREAVFSCHELIPAEQSIGRICGSPTVSCPPAVPIVISGEEITAEASDVMLQYGIREVSVMV